MPLDRMILDLECPPAVAVGDPVPITLRVRNDGIQPAALELTGRPTAFDIVVEQPDGTEVWRRLRGAAISMILQVTILQPGATLELADRWTQRDNAGRPVPPGSYLIRGAVLGPEESLRSQPRELQIVG